MIYRDMHDMNHSKKMHQVNVILGQEPMSS